MARSSTRSTSGQVSQPAPRVRAKKKSPGKWIGGARPPERDKELAGLHTQLEKRLHAAVCAYGNNYELGKMAGVPADVLSRFTRKVRNLRLDTAGRLAKVLGLTLTDEA
jgi:hypothetical protein